MREEIVNNRSKIIPITEQNWPIESTPVLTIFSWVFNHEKYIRESIDSILSQKTNFKVEIILHDDASNDGTKEIIIDYEKKHPWLFNNILQKKNQYSQGKSLTNPLFEKSKGKYIALMHGDDYWIDDLKLQKQYDFMIKHNECSFMFTNAYLKSNNKLTPIKTKFKNTKIIKFDDYLRNYSPTPTSSIILKKMSSFDNEINLNLINKFDKGDYVIRMLYGFCGDFGFISDYTCVYNKDSGGLSNSFGVHKYIIKNKGINPALNEISNFKYNWFFGRHDQQLHEKILYSGCREKKFRHVPMSFLKSLFNSQKKFIGFKKSLIIFKGAIKLLLTKG